MSDFKLQIEEDINEYQASKSALIPNLAKKEWAFNYWILDKFFYEDEDLIVDKIIDYNDKGIDCYEWYEDTKELYLIQNKYYDVATKLPLSYVKSTFLVDPLAVLGANSYLHCPELQSIYNAHKNDEQFTIRLQLYITNDASDPNIISAINEFNKTHGPRVMAEVYYLSDIERKWYGEVKKTKKNLITEIESVNSGTILNISNKDYGLDNGIDAKYALVPVSCIYRMMVEAQEKGYALFEDNIREYLGNKGINKAIYSTLKNPDERKNFFYYNNGITVICDAITGIKSKSSTTPHVGVSFSVTNPRVVNGCQTVSSIFTALKEYDKEDIDRQFKDTFVMVKILRIDPTSSEEKEIAKSIVRYNNSQNSIDEKNFTANVALFQRLKTEFQTKGYLLLTRQSDKNTYIEKYKKKSDLFKLQGKSSDRRAIFGLNDKQKLADLMIPLEKLLQVVLAFKVGGLAAYTQKKDILKPDTATYNKAIEFIKSSNVTSDVLLSLYLFFVRLEKEKNTEKNKILIPFYAVDAFCRYECEQDTGKIAEKIADNKQVERLIKLYTAVCDAYSQEFMEANKVDYIKMIKMDINYSRLEFFRSIFKNIIS